MKPPTDDGVQLALLVLPTDAQSSSAARLLTMWACRHLGVDADAPTAVVGELAANSIQHADAGEFSVRIVHRDGTLWIEVADRNTQQELAPRLAHLGAEASDEASVLAHLEDENGRGLVIVQALADQVDCRHTEVGMEVAAGFVIPSTIPAVPPARHPSTEDFPREDVTGNRIGDNPRPDSC